MLKKKKARERRNPRLSFSIIHPVTISIQSWQKKKTISIHTNSFTFVGNRFDSTSRFCLFSLTGSKGSLPLINMAKNTILTYNGVLFGLINCPGQIRVDFGNCYRYTQINKSINGNKCKYGNIFIFIFPFL